MRYGVSVADKVAKLGIGWHPTQRDTLHKNCKSTYSSKVLDVRRIASVMRIVLVEYKIVKNKSEVFFNETTIV